MIRSFADRRTEAIWNGRRPRGIARDLAERTLQKLLLLHVAQSIQELRVPPGNRLEALVGDRAGQWSIRVNRQWRLCFAFMGGDAYDVELVDYH